LPLPIVGRRLPPHSTRNGSESSGVCRDCANRQRNPLPAYSGDGSSRLPRAGERERPLAQPVERV